MSRAVLLVPVLSFLLVACAGADVPTDLVPAQSDTGSDPTSAPPLGGEADPAARLARAPAATAAAGTARTAIVATVSGLAGRPEPLTLQGTGAIDFAAGRSRSILDLAGALPTTPAGDAELETIVASGLLYVRAPVLVSLLGAATPWVRIDPTVASDGTTGESALGFEALTGLAGSDLTAPIALIAGVDASSVRAVDGSDKPGNVIHLRATVDLLAAAHHDDAPADLAALEAFLDRLGVRKLQVDVELDEGDRVRRIAYEHTVSTPAGAATQRFEVEYLDFGADVEIDVPPGSQVSDLADLRRQGPR